MANILTLVRVLLLFGIVTVWARESHVDLPWLDLAMVGVLAWVIFMDALDGWVARRRNEASEVGALLDIAGDRIVELVLWVFFAIRRDSTGGTLVPHWVPLVIITRTVATDLVRSVAFQHGRTPFGEKSMLDAAWARQLVSSRWSRAAYGALKAVTFCLLGTEVGIARAGLAGVWVEGVRIAADVGTLATCAFCVLRGVPVLWDGRRYFAPPPGRP